MSKRSSLYTFLGDEDEFVIFARSRDKAEAIFAIVNEPDHMMPAGWGGMEIEAWNSWGTTASIEQTTRNGWEGVGIYLSDRKIWTVVPVWKQIVL